LRFEILFLLVLTTTLSTPDHKEPPIDPRRINHQ
jgi:hypothetical protein